MENYSKVEHVFTHAHQTNEQTHKMKDGQLFLLIHAFLGNQYANGFTVM